jgi:hypothetical protein
MSLRNRLETLVVNPRLVEAGSDLAFATSLLEYYNKKKSLSSGRREWLDKLEYKYDAANWTDPLDCESGRTLNEILAHPDLSDRDKSFMESLKGALCRYGSLTEKQGYALGRTATRYTAEGIAALNVWTQQYNGEKRSLAKIAAAYYLNNPPYYGDLADKITNDEGFVPSEKQYKAIVENKYAQKVIAATVAEAKYTLNALIEGRASAPYNIRGKKAFILQIDAAPVTNAAKGTKNYLVLPVGEAAAILVEERAIKLVKKIK